MQVFLTESSWHNLLVCADSSFLPLLLQGCQGRALQIQPRDSPLLVKPRSRSQILKNTPKRFLTKSKDTPEDIPLLPRPICWEHIRLSTAHTATTAQTTDQGEQLLACGAHKATGLPRLTPASGGERTVRDLLGNPGCLPKGEEGTAPSSPAGHYPPFWQRFLHHVHPIQTQLLAQCPHRTVSPPSALCLNISQPSAPKVTLSRSSV